MAMTLADLEASIRSRSLERCFDRRVSGLPLTAFVQTLSRAARIDEAVFLACLVHANPSAICTTLLEAAASKSRRAAS